MITIDPPLETLTPKEKLELLDRVWESFGSQPHTDIDVPDWHGEVIRERLAEADRGEGSSSPLEEVHERLKRRFS